MGFSGSGIPQLSLQWQLQQGILPLSTLGVSLTSTSVVLPAFTLSPGASYAFTVSAVESRLGLYASAEVSPHPVPPPPRSPTSSGAEPF